MRKNRKFVILVAVVSLMIASALVYVILVGDTYSMHTHVFLASKSVPETRVELSDENVAELLEAKMENEELILVFKAKNPGKVNLKCKHRSGDDWISFAEGRSLTVSFMNKIYEPSPGEFSFNGFRVVICAFLAALLFTGVMMILMFRDYYKQGDYSYRMIDAGGFAIYSICLFVFILYRLLNSAFSSLSNFINDVILGGFLMLFAFAPIMLVMAFMLAFSNIWLLRNEGYRPVNALGIIFGVLWFFSNAISFRFKLFDFLWEIPNYGFIYQIIIYLVLYMESMFLSTVICSFCSVKHKPALDRDYIIILGCGIRKDGTLTPLLRGRVDSALKFEREQFESTGKHAVFVPSGGQGADEVIAEGEAMERYLLEKGVEPERILREDESVNTFQNMKFSKHLIEKRCGDIKNKKIAFATTNYHIFRGYILAQKNGFHAEGISAKTKPYFFMNAFLREFIGLIVDQKYKHLFVALMLIALFTVWFFFL